MNASSLFAAAICLSFGCSSGESTPSTTTDAATSVDSVASDTGSPVDSGEPVDTAMPTMDSAMAGDTPADAPADAPAACTPIANVGTAVSKTSVAGPPPAMTGGAIVPGTYALTKFELYAGGTGTSTHKETMEFGASTLSNVVSNDGGADKAGFFTYATAGATITLSATCGKMGSQPLKYTATATQFVMVAPSNPNQVQTYTKR